MLKVCPSCEDEFRRTMSECPDCHVALQLLGTTASPDEPGLGPLVAVHRDGPWTLEAIARLLQDAGIASRIDTYPPNETIDGPVKSQKGGHAGGKTELALYVEQPNADAARETVAAYNESQLPEHTGGDADVVLSECPACAEPLTGDATACASCGLEFPEMEVVCMACGQVGVSTAARCGNCGQEFAAASDAEA